MLRPWLQVIIFFLCGVQSKLTSFTGVAPRVMGIGPLLAIPMALMNTGLTQEDVDLFEASLRIIVCNGGSLTSIRSMKPLRHKQFTV